MGCKAVEVLLNSVDNIRRTDSLAPCVLFGVIHTLAGLAILSLAVWMYVDTGSYFSSKDAAHFFTSVYILMAAGAVMTVVSFLGCCGALQENPCMLGLFSFFLVLIFAAEVAGATYAWLHKDNVESFITEQMTKMVKHEYGVVEGIKEAVDAMQSNLRCCGLTSPSDWSTSAFNENEDGNSVISQVFYNVPASCCISSDICGTKFNIGAVGFGGIHNNGCIAVMKNRMQQHLTIVIGIGIGIAIIQILGFLFSLALCCSMRGEASPVFKA